MTTTDFIHGAKAAVAKVSSYKYDNVQPVWFGYILGNMKSILCIPGAEHDEMYEVTYNRSKGEIYVDRYDKVSNTLYKIEDLMNGIHITHQLQHWPKYDRYVIIATNDEGTLLGTVQLESWPAEQKSGGTAYLYALCVNADTRRQGVATALMDYTENIAKCLGHKTVTLEWDIRETPIEICEWYSRRGYDEIEFTPSKYALMQKQL